MKLTSRRSGKTKVKTQTPGNKRSKINYLPLVMGSLVVLGGAGIIGALIHQNKKTQPPTQPRVHPLTQSVSQPLVQSSAQLSPYRPSINYNNVYNYSCIDVVAKMFLNEDLIYDELQNITDSQTIVKRNMLFEIANGSNDVNNLSSQKRNQFDKIYDYIRADHNFMNMDNYVKGSSYFINCLKMFKLSDLFLFKFLGNTGFCSNNKCGDYSHHSSNVNDKNVTYSKNLTCKNVVVKLRMYNSGNENKILSQLFNHQTEKEDAKILTYVSKLPELLLVDGFSNEMNNSYSYFDVIINGKNTTYVAVSYALKFNYDNSQSILIYWRPDMGKSIKGNELNIVCEKLKNKGLNFDKIMYGLYKKTL